MKKLIAAVLTLAMICAVCMSVSASSITNTVEYENRTGSAVIGNVARGETVKAKDVIADVQALLATDSEEAKAAQEALKEVNVDVAKLKIVDEKTVTGAVSEENPCEVSITLNGVRPGVPVVVLFKAAAEDSAWEVLAVGVAPEVEVTFTAEGMFVVAIA